MDQAKEPKYACPRCGLATGHRGNFVYHLTRKNRCDPLVADVDTALVLEEMNKAYEEKPHKCAHCDKRFSHTSSMYAHQNACSSNPSFCRHLTAHQSGEGSDAVDRPSGQSFIYIYKPMNADASFVTRSVYANLIRPVKRASRLRMSVVAMVKMLFFCPRRPQNFCVYVGNKKLKKAMIWQGHAWATVDREDAVVEIRNVAYGLLVDFFDETQDDYECCTQDEWRSFIHRVAAGDSTTTFLKADKDIENAMIDFSPTVKAYIKNKKACMPERKYDDES
jgi:hypothetical protein